MRFVLILLLALQLWAGTEQMPTLFAQMGDPLFAFAQNAKTLKGDAVLGHEVSAYIAEAGAVRKTGLAAENEKRSEARTVYLHQLRGLKKPFDHLMLGVKREMLVSIKKGDTGRFMQLVSTEPPVAREDHTLRKEIAGFCVAEGLKGRSAFLDGVVQKEKTLETAYAGSTDSGGAMDREVIVIGTATCPYCIKARRFLREQGIPFRDLDVQSPYGRQLYSQHNGQGVPLILVGESRISGYNPQAILRAYGK